MKKKTTKNVLKVWKSKEDYDNGNADFFPFSDDELNNEVVISSLYGKILSREMYAFEIYERRSGETIIES